MANSCLPHTWNDPTPEPCSVCGKMLGLGERTPVWGGWLCDEHAKEHRRQSSERVERFKTEGSVVVSPAMMEAAKSFGRGLFNPAVDIAGKYYEAQKRMAAAGNLISQAIVANLDRIRAKNAANQPTTARPDRLG